MAQKMTKAMKDAQRRYRDGKKVFGFELELLASFLGAPSLMAEAERISTTS